MSIDITPRRAGPGDFIHIVGKDIHFEREDERCGVFFVDGSVARSPEYKTVSSDLVIAKVPSGLSAGPYLLRVRSGAAAAANEAQSVFFVEN